MNIQFILREDDEMETVDVDVPCLPRVGDLVWLYAPREGPRDWEIEGVIQSVTWAVYGHQNPNENEAMIEIRVDTTGEMRCSK